MANIEQLFKQRITECFIQATGKPRFFNLIIEDDENIDWAGMANNEGTIWLNLVYYRMDPEYFMRELIGHEVAHVVCFDEFPEAKQFHGREFRSIMSRLGLVGNTFLPPNMINETLRLKRLKASPYKYECKCKAWDISKLLHKRMTLEPRVCAKCKTTIKCVSVPL